MAFNFQRRLIDALQGLLEEEANASRLDLPVDLHELAYVIVRVIESYVYLDLIAGERSELERAAEPVAMIGVPPYRLVGTSVTAARQGRSGGRSSRYARSTSPLLSLALAQDEPLLVSHVGSRAAYVHRTRS